MALYLPPPPPRRNNVKSEWQCPSKIETLFPPTFQMLAALLVSFHFSFFGLEKKISEKVTAAKKAGE